MKKRHGYILWETGICLLLLIATSGSLAMLVHTIARSRMASRSFITERLSIESAAEECLAIEFDDLESYAFDLNQQGRIQVDVSGHEIGNVSGKMIHLQSVRYRRLKLTVWRFPDPGENRMQSEPEAGDPLQPAQPTAEKGLDDA